MIKVDLGWVASPGNEPTPAASTRSSHSSWAMPNTSMFHVHAKCPFGIMNAVLALSRPPVGAGEQGEAALLPRSSRREALVDFGFVAGLQDRNEDRSGGRKADESLTHWGWDETRPVWHCQR